MNRTLIALSALALAACKGDKSTSDSGSSDAENSCAATVSSSVPADGAADAYYRADVEFAISEMDASATVTVLDSSGAAVAGTQSTSSDGLTVYFTPDASLTPGASYTADISLCDGETNPSITFSTSTLGEALSGCELTGNTYNLNLGDARFVQPAGVADLLLGQLNSDVLFGVTSEDATSIEMMAGISAEGSTDQDYCTPTVPFPAADFSESPFFSVGPEDTTFNVAGFSVEISSLELSGTFSSDCSYFGGGVLAGELDARTLAPALADLVSDDPDEICTVVSSFGVVCESCASDGEPYCITVLADQLTADHQEGVMECVAEEDCHAECADVSKTCDTADYPVCE